MTVNHAISDLVSTIKNIQLIKKETGYSIYSKIREDILIILKNEGYIKDYKKVKQDNFEKLEITCAYHDGLPVIHEIKVISKPGRKVYCKADEIPKIYNGLGMIILSTPKGVIPDYKARELKIGGELLLKIF